MHEWVGFFKFLGWKAKQVFSDFSGEFVNELYEFWQLLSLMRYKVTVTSWVQMLEL